MITGKVATQKYNSNITSILIGYHFNVLISITGFIFQLLVYNILKSKKVVKVYNKVKSDFI